MLLMIGPFREIEWQKQVLKPDADGVFAVPDQAYWDLTDRGFSFAAWIKPGQVEPPRPPDVEATATQSEQEPLPAQTVAAPVLPLVAASVVEPVAETQERKRGRPRKG